MEGGEEMLGLTQSLALHSTQMLHSFDQGREFLLRGNGANGIRSAMIICMTRPSMMAPLRSSHIASDCRLNWVKTRWQFWWQLVCESVTLSGRWRQTQIPGTHSFQGVWHGQAEKGSLRNVVQFGFRS
jgi:hypothetical protein